MPKLAFILLFIFTGCASVPNRGPASLVDEKKQERRELIKKIESTIHQSKS